MSVSRRALPDSYPSLAFHRSNLSYLRSRELLVGVYMNYRPINLTEHLGVYATRRCLSKALRVRGTRGGIEGSTLEKASTNSPNCF